jgi:transposase
LLPVFLALNQAAAQAELIGADDTGVKILSHLKAQQLVPEKKRRATHTTGIVAQSAQSIIVLLKNGAHHAGEVIGKLLKLRDGNLPKPIQMGDASSSNWCHEQKVISAKCWAHAGRGFKELAASFPVEVKFVRGMIAELYKTERKVSSLKLTAAERLLLHQAESGPVLLRLEWWIKQQFEAKLVEPNSALGKEIKYLENHWYELTEFTRTAGVPLDNNATERALRRPGMLRNNSLFFQTEHGAYVGGLLMSILATCQANAVNAWEYLLSAYRNARAVREKPEDWTPWRWAELQGQPSG